MKIYYVAGLPYSDELCHHGIKGQKWGVRRYQNPDGTLTTLGKVRYGAETAAKTVGKAASATAEYIGRGVSSFVKKRHPKLMSDDELRVYTDRLRLEKNYNQALQEMKSSKKRNVVLKTIGDTLSKFGNRLINRGIDEAVNKIFEKPEKTTDWADVLKNPNSYSDKDVESAVKRSSGLKVLLNNEKEINKGYEVRDKKSDTYGTAKDASTVFQNRSKGANSFGSHKEAKNWSKKVDWGTPYSNVSSSSNQKTSNGKEWTKKKSKVFEADYIYDSYDQYQAFKKGSMTVKR